MTFFIVPRLSQIYPHIYPLWGIVFVLVFDYTDSQEHMLQKNATDAYVHCM